MNILLPKAISEQARWQAAIAPLGVQLRCVDPWHLALVPQTPVTKSMWLNIDEYAGVICVSPTAASVLVNALDTYWPMPPADVHWLCNGPRTAEVLNAHGLLAVYPEAGHTAEHVLALSATQAVEHDKWLIVKGEGGRVTYQQTLTKRGAEVTELEVYQRSVDQSCLAQLPEQAEQSDALWLSSEFLGEQIFASAPDFWLHWPGQWWVSSPRLQQWAQQKGIVNIRLANGATTDALHDLILQHGSRDETGDI